MCLERQDSNCCLFRVRLKQLEAWTANALHAGEEGTRGLLASEQGLIHPGSQCQHLSSRLSFCVPPTLSPRRVGWWAVHTDEGGSAEAPALTLSERPSRNGNRCHHLMLTGSCFPRVVPFQPRSEYLQSLEARELVVRHLTVKQMCAPECPNGGQHPWRGIKWSSKHALRSQGKIMGRLFI